MAQDEFAIIERYFSNIGKPAANLALGIGDDAAVVEVPPAEQLVVRDRKSTRLNSSH
jgi:thiamine monophosphate kinase